MGRIGGVVAGVAALAIGCSSGVDGVGGDEPCLSVASSLRAASSSVSAEPDKITAHIRIEANGVAVYDVTPENVETNTARGDLLYSIWVARHWVTIDHWRRSSDPNDPSPVHREHAIRIDANDGFKETKAVSGANLDLTLYWCDPGATLAYGPNDSDFYASTVAGDPPPQCFVGPMELLAAHTSSLTATVTALEGESYSLKATGEGITIDITVEPPLPKPATDGTCPSAT